MLEIMVPYTGSIGAHVRQLEPGFARVTMRDQRAIRNHLHSIHAIALANLGEVTSGLAMITAAPSESRSILVGLSVTYLKKARGTLQATCRCPVTAPVVESTEPVVESTEQVVEAEITDGTGAVVATVKATWRLSPAIGER